MPTFVVTSANIGKRLPLRHPYPISSAPIGYSQPIGAARRPVEVDARTVLNDMPQSSRQVTIESAVPIAIEVPEGPLMANAARIKAIKRIVGLPLG